MSFEYFVPIMLVALFSVRMLSRSMVFVFSLIFFILASWSSHQTLSPPETRYFGTFLDYARAISGLGLGFCAWKIFESGTVRGLPKWNGTLFILIISGFFAVALMSVSIPFLGFLMPSIIVAAMFVGANVRTFFSSQLFQWAGRLSFGVYMVHSPVLVAFVGYFGEAAMKGNVALKCCAIFVSFALAFVLHIFIENWGMKIGRSWVLSNHTGIKATENS